MDRQIISHIKALFASISDLPLHVLDSVDSDLTCIDSGLRTHFDQNQLYDELHALLSRELCTDTILHLQDVFHLHYLIFMPDASDRAFCAFGPFIEPSASKTSYPDFLRQIIHLPVFSLDAVLGAARCTLSLLSNTSIKTVKDLQLHTDPALLARLSSGAADSTDPVILRLQYYIQTHLHQKLTLQSLAEHLGFSPTYISHHFKKETGMSPVQYILQQRLLRAQYLLRTTGTPIKEIADAVGIPDCSYFTKMFREHTGTTPSEYRNTH